DEPAPRDRQRPRLVPPSRSSRRRVDGIAWEGAPLRRSPTRAAAGASRTLVAFVGGHLCHFPPRPAPHSVAAKTCHMHGRSLPSNAPEIGLLRYRAVPRVNPPTRISRGRALSMGL